MATSTLVKTLLHGSVADSVYREITSKTGRYYYFLGSVLDWLDPATPPAPIDSYDYEQEVRKNIVVVKEILPSDVSYVVDRINWQANVVYDMYDDAYSDRLVGINLVSGGANYSSNVTINITGGGGSGASATATVLSGAITGITLTQRGQGYTSTPNVSISDAYGSGAIAEAVMCKTRAGGTTLQGAQFYVVTDDFNIYKCLDNNNGAASTVKPTDVSFTPVTTADGYKWKFMGNVPIFLRNKFLSETQVPVTTSIKNQFYSKGEIKNINIRDTGNNYNYARIVVQGDGYQEDDPYLVVNYLINNGGAGYSTATVTIDPPISGAASWAASTVVGAGQLLTHENNIYEVVVGGTTGPNAPVHTKNYDLNGTALLKYRATGITANANISGGSIVGLSNLNGLINDVVITNGGFGYNAVPPVTITGNGANAAAYAVLTGNSVSKIVVFNSGKNYTTGNVTIGAEWAANTTMNANSQVFYNTRLYTVTTQGASNTTPPQHITGSQTLGTAVFTYAGQRATAYPTIKYGSGYTRAPNVSVTGDGANANISFQAQKTEAVIYPFVEDGKITHAIIDEGGIGYTYATLTVVGDGSNASISADFSQGDLDTLQATSELLAVSGAIHTIQVVSGGYGYTNAAVSISGDGTGATATATVTNGKVTKITMTNEGSGYTYAVITITGNGKGATARAIIPPYGGHGKDTVKELFSRTLGFYSTIGQETVQGFDIVNDYRQFGIIKNIRNYGNNKYFNDSVGSPCWVLSGDIDPTVFKSDVQLTRSSDSARYLIVSSTTTGMIVQSIDNKAPSTGDVLSTSSNQTFTVVGVFEPDVDKYSGEMLLVDNRLAFSTTPEQAVSLKTVIKY